MKRLPVYALLTTGALGFIYLMLFHWGDRTIFTAPPEMVGSGFFMALSTRRYPQARHYLEESLQQRVSADDLRRWHRRWLAKAARIDSISPGSYQIRGDEATAEVEVATAKGNTTVTLPLRWHAGEWKIKSVEILRTLAHANN